MGEVEDQHPSDYCTTSNENVGGNSADDGITRSLDYNVRTLAQYCSQGNVRRGFQTGIES